MGAIESPTGLSTAPAEVASAVETLSGFPPSSFRTTASTAKVPAAGEVHPAFELASATDTAAHAAPNFHNASTADKPSALETRPCFDTNASEMPSTPH
mmetsp:Transcript_27401/g.55148  ORF Transcript_27401/g.55148 Transcript_27401/m.55148 type:complete len:98 (+) Transcript_27401:162-455(+)